MPAFTLTIVYTPGAGGGVRVDGPIHDKGLCYAMLGLAQDAVRDHVAQAQAGTGPRLVVPELRIPDAPNGGRG
jgi:hypothetical protein